MGATLRFSRKYVGIDYALLPNREWNQKQKHKKPLAVHGEKPLMITRFLGKKPHQISQTILHGRNAILRVRAKWLIINMVIQLWADVKYHVPTGLIFRRGERYFSTDATLHHNVATCLWHVSMQTNNVSPHWKYTEGISPHHFSLNPIWIQGKIVVGKARAIVKISLYL